MPKLKRRKTGQCRGPKGRGTVFPDRRRGGYRWKVPIGRYPNGKTKYTEGSADTKGEAVEAMKHAAPPGDQTTVAQWATRWLASLTNRESTKDAYRRTLEKR